MHRSQEERATTAREQACCILLVAGTITSHNAFHVRTSSGSGIHSALCPHHSNTRRLQAPLLSICDSCSIYVAEQI